MTLANYNPIALFQEELAARLSADEYFSDITVLTERTADLENTIDRALKVLTKKDGKFGVAVVVGLFTSDADLPNVPGPELSNAATRVTVYEHVLFNGQAAGTGKAAVDVAMRVARVLHHYLAGGVAQTVLVTGKDVIIPVPQAQLEPGIMAYQVRIESNVDGGSIAKVAPVTLGLAGGVAPLTCTLTCATSGAAIYYTTDYSYPWSGNTNAHLYSAPFSIAAACLLRAVAHKTGMVASDAAAAEITAA